MHSVQWVEGTLECTQCSGWKPALRVEVLEEAHFKELLVLTEL